MRIRLEQPVENAANTLKIRNRFEVTELITCGSSSSIYKGRDIQRDDDIAVKLEPVETRHSQLLNESNVYKSLRGGEGVPEIRWYGSENNYNILVLPLLGPSLEDLLSICSGKFTLPTVLKIADQTISRLAFLHSKGYVHRDIKPANFLLGRGETSNLIYLIDYGLAKKIINAKTKAHVQYREDRSLIGTARYASIYCHHGIEQSRRDDMESLGYVLIYFARGSLPWQCLKTVNKKQKYEKITELKMSLPVEKLCEGLPVEFVYYLKYCRKLAFEEEPNYNELRKRFKNLLERISHFNEQNFTYDWILVQKKQKQ